MSLYANESPTAGHIGSVLDGEDHLRPLIFTRKYIRRGWDKITLAPDCRFRDCDQRGNRGGQHLRPATGICYWFLSCFQGLWRRADVAEPCASLMQVRGSAGRAGSAAHRAACKSCSTT